MAIIDLYDIFYGGDESEDKGKSDKEKLDEVTSVESSIDITVKSSETKSNPTSSVLLPYQSDSTSTSYPKGDTFQMEVEVGPKTPTNNNSVDVTLLAKESEEIGEKLGHDVAVVITPVITPIIEEVIKESEKVSSNSPSIAVVSDSEDSEDSTKPTPTSKAYDAVNVALVEVINKINNEMNDQMKAEVAQAIDVTTSNDVAKEAFQAQLREEIYHSIKIVAPDFDKWESSDNMKEYIKGEINPYVVEIVNSAVDAVSQMGSAWKNLSAQALDSVSINPLMETTKSTLDAGSYLASSAGNIVTGLADRFGEYVADINSAFKDVINSYTIEPAKWVTDMARNELDKVMNHLDEVWGGINKKLNDLVDKATSSDFLPWKKGNIDSLKFPDLVRNHWKYLRDGYRYVTTFDWIVKITPYRHTMTPTPSDTPPSLCSYLGLSDLIDGNLDYIGYLPIVSYSLAEAGLEPMSFTFLSNTIIMPQSYKRPSKLTITLPDMYVYDELNKPKNVKSYIRRFKEDYMEYVKTPKSNKIYSLVSRDYRECCYKVTVYRFPYVSNRKRKLLTSEIAYAKTYLAIPNISINDSGNDSKQVVLETLTFDIIGEL